MKTFRYKLVLLGESSVGKSSLVLRFVNDQFHEAVESTIGAAFLIRSVTLDGVVVKYEIWDTAGQERYHSLAPMYYRGAQAAIVVYDMSSMATFEKAKTWVKELQRQADPSIVICLVGNKSDLEHREVDELEASRYSDEHRLLFFEASAKTGSRVDEMFCEIAKQLPKTETVEADPVRLQGDADCGNRGCC